MDELSVNEVADRLHLEPRWVRELLVSGRLGGYKTGRKWVISKNYLDAYLNSVQPRVGTRGRLPIGFADLVQKHWSDLMPILVELRGIEPFPVHDYDLVRWHHRIDVPCWPITKGQICRAPDSELIVRLDAEGKLEWTCLQQHLPGDPVWSSLIRWKQTMAEDVAARLILLETVKQLVQSPSEDGGLGWLVIEETGPTFLGLAQKQPPAVSMYYPFRLYDQVLSRSQELTLRGYEKKDLITIDEHGVELGGHPLLYATERAQREEAISFFLESQESLVSLPEARAAALAYRRTTEQTATLIRELDRLRLTPGFPPGSKCEVCELFVSPAPSGTDTPSGS